MSVVNSSFATAGDKFAGKVARLELSGPVSWAKDESLPASYSAVHLGDDGTSSVVGWGAMSLDGGAVMDNNAVFVGVRGVGALTVSDGEFRHRDVGEYFCYRDRHARIGSEANAYGYAGFTNSAVTIEGGFKLGYKAASTGMMSLRGGSLDVGDSLTEIGGGGYGDFYLGNGATFRMAPKSSGWCRLVLGFEIHSEIDYGVTDLPGGTSILTVDSGASALLSRLDISPSSNRSQINLNDGGLLSVFQIFYKDPNHNRPAGGRSIISFNGGTLKCRDEWGYGKTFPQDCPDLTVVHEGGAIVDIPRYTYATNNMAFLRPTGKVFKTVTKPTDADFLASVNVGPARLVFEDAPDVDVPGEGATGFIAFDAKGKCLGDVVITSPGTGYHDGAKAYAVIPQYPNRRFECGVELAAAKGGGLTKTNGGELYLTQVNTYEGPTVVRDGFLKAMVAGAIPAGTVLRVEGGKLDLNSTVDTFETVEGTGGTLDGVKGGLIRLQRLSTAGCNGVNLGTASISVEGDWKVDAADLAAAKARGFVATYPASVDFARGSTIEISGVADALDPEAGAYELFAVGAGKTVTGLVDVTLKDDPDNMWKVKVGSKGISLVYRTGLMLIVR